MQRWRVGDARSAATGKGLYRPDGSLDPAAVRAAVPACLGCGYDLRGMSGLTPICPECGLRHDLPGMIARLAAGRELGRRMADELSVPIAWLVVMLLAAGGWISAILSSRGDLTARDAWVVTAWLFLTFTGWVLLLRAAERRAVVGGGLAAAMLMHLVFLGYLVGPLVTVVSMMLVGANIVEGSLGFGVPRMIAGWRFGGAIAWSIYMIVGAAIWWGTAQLYRLILERCVVSALLSREGSSD